MNRPDIESLKAFITETCTIAPKKAIKRNTLYYSYVNWCISKQKPAYSKREFYNAIRTLHPELTERRRTFPDGTICHAYELINCNKAPYQDQITDLPY